MTTLPLALSQPPPSRVITPIPIDDNRSDSQVHPPPRLSPEVASSTRGWSFNVHDIPKAQLPALCYGVLLEHPEFATVGANTRRLWRFVSEIAARYRDMPFHSFRHAVDVTICCSYLVVSTAPPAYVPRPTGVRATGVRATGVRATCRMLRPRPTPLARSHVR